MGAHLNDDICAQQQTLMSSTTEGSTKAIFYAQDANGGIELAKFGAAVYTRSEAMLSEAIHYLADCTNQVFSH
jgi:divalent metal cation (Fe/Co/Zn/Cd) transporter